MGLSWLSLNTFYRMLSPNGPKMVPKVSQSSDFSVTFWALGPVGPPKSLKRAKNHKKTLKIAKITKKHQKITKKGGEKERGRAAGCRRRRRRSGRARRQGAPLGCMEESLRKNPLYRGSRLCRRPPRPFRCRFVLDTLLAPFWLLDPLGPLLDPLRLHFEPLRCNFVIFLVFRGHVSGP